MNKNTDLMSSTSTVNHVTRVDPQDGALLRLMQRCLAAMFGYDRRKSLVLRLSRNEVPLIDRFIREYWSSWDFYVNHDTLTLYMGTPEQLARVRPNSLRPEAIEHTFAISPVEPSTQRYMTCGIKDTFTSILNQEPEAYGSSVQRLIQSNGRNGLTEAAHRAFSGGHRLVLGPDEIWLTIIQGLAWLANHEPETFHGRLALDQNSHNIVIQGNDFVPGSPANDWADAFDQVSMGMASKTGLKNHQLLAPSFTTSGPIERLAASTVLTGRLQPSRNSMDASVCGIPSVTLLGRIDDWTKLQQKVFWLTQLGDLSWWLTDVLSIIDEFVNAASLYPNIDFWRDIHKLSELSGRTAVSGWLVRLLPLTLTPHGKPQRNPLLARPYTSVDSICASSLPSSLSWQPFTWKHQDCEHQYRIVAGIAGYWQSDDGQSLRPQIAWSVVPDNARE